MENKSVTAVEWLQERYNRRQVYEESIWDEEFEQAKEMEKEQTIKFTYSFFENCFTKDGIIQKSFEEYYNETYNK